MIGYKYLTSFTVLLLALALPGFAQYLPIQTKDGNMLKVEVVVPIWTPSNEIDGLIFWLDATDASTITLNGNNVSQWDSVVGSNSATQGTAAMQPEYSNNIVNGKAVVSWRWTGANDDHMDLPNIVSGVTSVTMICVHWPYADSAGANNGAAINLSLQTPSTANTWGSTAIAGRQLDAFSTATRNNIGTGCLYEKTHCYAVRHQGNNIQTWQDFSLAYTNAAKAVAWVAADWGLGDSTSTHTLFYNGHICEIIIWNRILDIDTITNSAYLMGYITNKWGPLN